MYGQILINVTFQSLKFQFSFMDRVQVKQNKFKKIYLVFLVILNLTLAGCIKNKISSFKIFVYNESVLIFFTVCF